MAEEWFIDIEEVGDCWTEFKGVLLNNDGDDCEVWVDKRAANPGFGLRDWIVEKEEWGCVFITWEFAKDVEEGIEADPPEELVLDNIRKKKTWNMSKENENKTFSCVLRRCKRKGCWNIFFQKPSLI